MEQLKKYAFSPIMEQRIPHRLHGNLLEQLETICIILTTFLYIAMGLETLLVIMESMELETFQQSHCLEAQLAREIPQTHMLIWY